MRPSFIVTGLNGILLLVVIIYVMIYWGSFGDYQRTIILSLIAIQIGIHAILHHVEEIYYHYNPLENIRSFEVQK
jgi:hypothetical protein